MSHLIERAAERIELLGLTGAVKGGRARTRLAPEGRAEPALQEPDLRQSQDSQRHHSANSTDVSRGEIAQPNHVKLDLGALAAAGMGHTPGSRLTDEFRIIKRPLLRNVMGRGGTSIANGNLIMVTSALPGEGKSFTAVNLALSISAEINYKVMLVDADVVRPSILQRLGIPLKLGLLDVLQDESIDLSKVLLRTNIEKLSILPAGTPCAAATELLASDAMAALLDEMANRYSDRILVFDSPPLLLTTESHVLASHMGQIVVVVNTGHTLQKDVSQALATIEDCPVKMIVLNKVRTTSPVGYGYGYALQDDR